MTGRWLLLFRYLNLGTAARRRRIDRGHDVGRIRLNEAPVIRAQHHERDFPSSQILLVAQLLIRRNEQIEACFLRSI